MLYQQTVSHQQLSQNHRPAWISLTPSQKNLQVFYQRWLKLSAELSSLDRVWNSCKMSWRLRRRKFFGWLSTLWARTSRYGAVISTLVSSSVSHRLKHFFWPNISIECSSLDFASEPLWSHRSSEKLWWCRMQHEKSQRSVKSST